MATVTDPARELSDVAQHLLVGTSAGGAEFLAGKFGVQPWSTEFVKIIGCIMERADLVGRILRRADLDPDHRDNALTDLKGFKAAFTAGALIQPWSAGGAGLSLMREHGKPLQYLSSDVRPFVSYPKLTPEEVEELLVLIESYLSELTKSDEGPDFVRQAITDGLTLFQFQLKHIGWIGAGYALSAFRELMFVYDAAQNEYSSRENVDSEAILGGLWKIMTSFKEKVDTAKGWGDTGLTLLKWYQAGAAIATPALLAIEHYR